MSDFDSMSSIIPETMDETLRALAANNSSNSSSPSPTSSPTSNVSPFGIGDTSPTMPIWGTSLLIVLIIAIVAVGFFIAMGKKISLPSFRSGDSHSEAESKAITEAAMYQRQLLAAANMVNLQQQNKNKQRQDPWKQSQSHNSQSEAQAQSQGQGGPVGSFGKRPSSPPILYSKQKAGKAPYTHTSGGGGSASTSTSTSPQIQGRTAHQPKAQSIARVKQNIKDAMSRYASNRSLEEQRIKSMEEDRKKRDVLLYGGGSNFSSNQQLSPGIAADDRNERKGSQGLEKGAAGGNEKVKAARSSTRRSTRRREENQVADSNLAGYTTRRTIPKAPKPTIPIANRTPKESPSGAGAGFIGNRGISFSRLKASMHNRMRASGSGSGRESDLEKGEGRHLSGEEEEHVEGVEEEYEQVGPPLDEHRPLSTGILSAVSSSVSQPRVGASQYEAGRTEEGIDRSGDAEANESVQRPKGLSYARQSFARFREKVSNVVRPVRPPPGLGFGPGPRKPPPPPRQDKIQPEHLDDKSHKQQVQDRGSYRRPLSTQDYDSSVGGEDSYTTMLTEVTGSQRGTGAVRMKEELGEASSYGRSGTGVTEFQARYSQAPEAFSTTGSQTFKSQRQLTSKKSSPLIPPGTARQAPRGPPPRRQSQKSFPAITRDQQGRAGPPNPPV